MGLNQKQRKFADGVLRGKPAAQAYVDAGYAPCNDATARSNASQLLTNTNVKAYIDAANAKAAQKAELTAEWVITRLMKSAERTDDAATHAGVNRALELLGKRLGMFADQVVLSGPDGGPIEVVEVVCSTREEAAAVLAALPAAGGVR